MPRVTPLRGLKLILLVYIIVIGLWITLPSPSFSPSERKSIIQETLKSGRGLTLYREHDELISTNGTSIFIEWKLTQINSDKGDDHVVLGLDDMAFFNLEGIIAASEDFNAHWTSNDSAWIPFFGNFLDPELLAIGYGNSLLNLPWFHPVDREFFALERGSWHGVLYPRFIVPMPGVIQLWNDGVVNATLGKEKFEKLGRYFCVPMWEYSMEVAPECSELTERRKLYEDAWGRLGEADRQAGLLATFKSSDMKDISDVVVDITGELPSKTYPIRRTLLAILTPVIQIGLFLRHGLYEAFMPLLWLVGATGLTMVFGYAAVVAVCWIAAGLPEFSKWSAEFWLTKSFRTQPEDLTAKRDVEDRVEAGEVIKRGSYV